MNTIVAAFNDDLDRFAKTCWWSWVPGSSLRAAPE
jgi:hypothetical protein